LHEQLNEELRSKQQQQQQAKDSDDEEPEQVKLPDPHFIDEDELRKQEEELTDEQKRERLDEAQATKSAGNELFKQESFQEALEIYTKALMVCPMSCKKERSVFHSNRSVCYFKLVSAFRFVFLLCKKRLGKGF
jgi:hypothetical protein